MSGSWKELSEKLKALQKEFIRTTEALEKSKREKTGVCGFWSPKQVVAHMTGWDKEVIRQFKLFQDGLEQAIEHDIDEFNKQSVHKRRHLSWQKTLVELKDTHTEFNLVTSSISLREISASKEYMAWMEVQIEHYIHHIEQLKKWVE